MLLLLFLETTHLTEPDCAMAGPPLPLSLQVTLISSLRVTFPNNHITHVSDSMSCSSSCQTTAIALPPVLHNPEWKEKRRGRTYWFVKDIDGIDSRGSGQ